jgi:4-amino-4-deoxy-L-arabinose transferase-like glycosyltransferase
MMWHRLAFPVLLCAFVVLALAYSVIVPLGEAPDEVPHFAYVQFLAQQHRLPANEGAVLGESFQPPLFYVTGALTTFWISQDNFQVIANPDFALDDPQAPNLLLHTRREALPNSGWPLAWHLVRVLSIAMGAVTVWATWQLAHEIFPGQRWIALGAASFVAFLPEFLIIRAAVNNDNLNVMLSSLGVLQLVRMLRQPLRAREGALVGVILGLAVLTKLSGLVVWIFAAAIFLNLARQGRNNWRTVAASAALCFGIAFAILSPWMLYEQIQYSDPLGWSNILSTTPIRSSPITLADAIAFERGLFTSFWGRFGGMLQLSMSDLIYAGLGALVVLALLGWVGYARDALNHKLESSVRSLFVLTCLFWLILLVAHVRFSLSVLGTDQGRQLFPGLPLLAVFLVVGLGRILGRSAAIVWGGGLFTLSLAVALYLNSIYSPPVLNTSSLTPLGGLLAPVNFGETIRMSDYHIEETKATPGSSITVGFYWQAINPPSENYWLLLQLVGKSGGVATKEGVPSAGRVTTDWWQTGQSFFSYHRLIVPQDLAPGRYTLQVGLHPFGRWEWLPVRGRDAFTLGSVLVTTTP